MTEPSLLEPSIALAAYAEPLAANRRVLVFGSALASLSLQLLERGARSVHVCDPDAVRVAEASTRNRSTQISFSSLADSDLSVREGAFELALIDNLGAFDALSVLKVAKRAIGTRGAAVVACPNPEASFPLLKSSNPGATALDYYALYDAFCKGKLLPPGSHLSRQLSRFAMRLAGVPAEKSKRLFGIFG